MKLKYKEVHRKAAKRWYEENKEYALDHHREWLLKNPGWFKNWHLKRNYNLTLEQVEKMLSDQNYKCGICLTELNGSKVDLMGRTLPKWTVDHDHESGKVRGVLCIKCNMKLGALEDTQWVSIAQKYLERSM